MLDANQPVHIVVTEGFGLAQHTCTGCQVAGRAIESIAHVVKQGGTFQHLLACQQALGVTFLNTCQCASQSCSVLQPVVACKFPNFGIACSYRCQVAVTIVGIAYRYDIRSVAIGIACALAGCIVNFIRKNLCPSLYREQRF